jgi:hypothetical protein
MVKFTRVSSNFLSTHHHPGCMMCWGMPVHSATPPERAKINIARTIKSYPSNNNTQNDKIKQKKIKKTRKPYWAKPWTLISKNKQLSCVMWAAIVHMPILVHVNTTWFWSQDLCLRSQTWIEQNLTWPH